MENNNIYSIACDFGSSGGKIYLGTFNGDILKLEEIHRFSLEPIQIRNYFYTDVLYMWSELLIGLKKITAQNIQPTSLSIDTWGVDYAYLDKNGRMLANPVNYRTERTFSTPKKLEKIGLSSAFLYEKTGIAPMPYNSLFQIYEDLTESPDLIHHAQKLLPLPDLFAYWLTGEMSTEFTIASTTQLLNIHSLEWDEDLLSAIKFPKHILPDLKETSSIKGNISPEVAKIIGCAPFIVIAGCSHDTASAVLASPLSSDHSLFISSGSWSLIGMERENPILTSNALSAGFANEIGYGKSIRFLKSINGLWILQLLQRKWNISFPAMISLAEESMGKNFYIDVTDPIFYKNSDIEESIISHCKKYSFLIPTKKSEILASVYEGFGRVHAKSVSEFEEISKQKIESIHIIGGGCQDKLFYQTIKDYTKKSITIKPIQATALGNVLSQLLGLSVIKSKKEARDFVIKSFDVKNI